MNKKYKIGLLIILIVAAVVLGAFLLLHGKNIPVLEPKGPIAEKERNLLYFGLGLSLIIVIPVFIITFGFAWKYREANYAAKYSPDLDGNRIAETIWWIIPTALIGILAVVTWRSTYQLNPYNPIVSSANSPLTVQVVALNWKWLFIYPQQHIASINLLEIPVNTPVNFQITSDAPMNSFWIPQLGGQIYAMPGMSTQLNLLASSPGDYSGSSANISGDGFAGMSFITRATSSRSFLQWVLHARTSTSDLSQSEYNEIAKPSENNPVSYYIASDPTIYNDVIDKYMPPNQSGTNMSAIGGVSTASTLSMGGM